MLDQDASNKIPPGFKLRHTLRDRENYIRQIKWSSDGLTLASTTDDWLICLWNPETGQLLRTLEGQYGKVRCFVWSPDSRLIASGHDRKIICIWDSETGRLHKTIKEDVWGQISSLAWSPDGRLIASVGTGSVICVRNAETGQPLQMFDEPRDTTIGTTDLAWSPDGRLIATAGSDSYILLWDVESGRVCWDSEAEIKSVDSVTWSPDGRMLIYGGEDIQLTDAQTGRAEMLLQGHTQYVKCVSFSSDGRLLASLSVSNEIILWRCDSWDRVAMLDGVPVGLDANLAFHPKSPVLATVGGSSRGIHIWDYDLDTLLRSPLASRTVTYTNAKVALVGETGVGKTGLGVRLAEGVWRPTAGSTHGMNVWTLHSTPEREVMLWDFAGQDEYRLIHQLFLNETTVALMLYDPTKSNDTFFGVDYWEKALKNAVRGDVQKFLVAARVDVGSVRMLQVEIDAYCKTNGYIAHFATSAETNEGCEELRTAVLAAIPWERLLRTSSPEVFKQVKDFLATVRQGNRVLIREHDLLVEFNAQEEGSQATEAEFRRVIRHVETAGLIKRLSFGKLILLKPELLNKYASNIVDAARRHPDGLGAVPKSDVLAARTVMREEGNLEQSDKLFLLHATVELFIQLGLALEQDGKLVFPSKFNKKMPPLQEDPVVAVEFAFEGPVENIYTTLVVKLYYGGGVFRLQKLWKNAAEFLDARDQVCGFQLQNEGSGRGTLKVFFAEGVSDDHKALFLKFIADHFADKHIGVRRQRIYRCSHCRELVRDRNAVRRAQERKVSEMPCQYCFRTFPLFDALETLYRNDEKFLLQVAAMGSMAEAGMVRGGGLVSAAAELRTENFKNWAGGADIATIAIAFTDVLNSTNLNVEMGDESWREVREAHFARAKKIINERRGYLIKTIGDSVMAGFHSASDALDFALALSRNTGSEVVRIRVGIHIGPVEVNTSDAFGQQVSMAARVEDKAKQGGIWVSAKVKGDIDILRATRHHCLRWTKHPDEELKGFPGRFTLWSVEE